MSRRDKISRLREHHPVILPSMLLCDFGNLEREIRALEQSGYRALHLDVMDGVFVPNFSYGISIVHAINQITELPLDVHLMMTNPGRYVKEFYDAGADLLTFHFEAVDGVDEAKAIVRDIHDLGAAAGLAINPQTSVESVAEVLPECDLALVMSVHPGFGGQSFIEDVLPKLEQIRSIAGNEIILEIDGGINANTIGKSVNAGAQWTVVGSGIFKHDDYTEALATLNECMCVNGN